ncbi:6-phosphogluconolactonase [Enteropsectra breve]|nr:6-phosphogluconolactonase [Enteropsectra breve]
MTAIIRTANFKETIYKILEKYSGKELNLMIAGGSLLNILAYEKTGTLNTGAWKIYFADERVEQGHLNYSGAQDFLNLTNCKFFPMETSLGAKEAAEKYNKILDGVKIDLCLLGIGDNGHICSLWPESDSLESKENVVGVCVECPLSPQRVTTTLKFLNESVSCLYFVIPPKNGKPKSISEPHESIRSRLTKEYTVVLPE